MRISTTALCSVWTVRKITPRTTRYLVSLDILISKLNTCFPSTIYQSLLLFLLNILGLGLKNSAFISSFFFNTKTFKLNTSRCKCQIKAEYLSYSSFALKPRVSSNNNRICLVVQILSRWLQVFKLIKCETQVMNLFVFFFLLSATRVQFFAIEIARNREGYNDTVHKSKCKSKS